MFLLPTGTYCYLCGTHCHLPLPNACRDDVFPCSLRHCAVESEYMSHLGINSRVSCPLLTPLGLSLGISCPGECFDLCSTVLPRITGPHLCGGLQKAGSGVDLEGAQEQSGGKRRCLQFRPPGPTVPEASGRSFCLLC